MANAAQLSVLQGAAAPCRLQEEQPAQDAASRQRRTLQPGRFRDNGSRIFTTTRVRTRCTVQPLAHRGFHGDEL